MIKAKVVSFTLSESVDSITKLDLETYLEDQVDLSSFCVGMDFDGQGQVVIIMTKEEYCDSVDDFVHKRELLIDENEKLREENKKLEEENKALDSVSDVLRKSLLDEREKTKELKEENKKLEEECKSTVSFCPDGTIVFRSKKVSELEKEVEKLEKSKSDMWLERNTLKAENERLQKKIEDLDKSNKRLNGQYIQLNCENITLKKKLERLQDAAEVNIHTDGPIVFRQLEEENKDLKKDDDEVKPKISDEFSLKITGGLFYYKED